MQDHVGLAHLFQGGAERLHQFVRQVGNEAHGVRQDRRPPVRQLHRPECRVQGGEQHVLGLDLGARQAVEQGRLAGVGVAHQSQGRERRALARRPLQPAGAAHVLELALELDDALGQKPPVGLDLGLTRAAKEAEAAALALKVGPGPYKTRALVGQPRQFDLQPALARAGPATEDLQDQAGPVDHLGLPRLLQIALLHRREGVVDHHYMGVACAAEGGDLVGLALAEQRSRRDRPEHRDHGVAHVQIERLGETDSLGEALLRRPQVPRPTPDRVDDDGGFDRGPLVDGTVGQSSS